MLEGNDFDLEVAHAFPHSSSEFYPECNKVTRARIDSWYPEEARERERERERDHEP